MTIRYVFAQDYSFPNARDADADAIGAELDALNIRDAEELSELQADETWRWARAHPQSALHGHFTWDEREAAIKTWRDEARSIIRSLRRIDDENPDEEPRRVYLSVNHGGLSYRRVEEIEQSQSLQEKLLEAADRDLAAWQNRYRSIVDVCPIVQEAREALRRQIEREQTARQGRGRRRGRVGDEARP